VACRAPVNPGTGLRRWALHDYLPGYLSARLYALRERRPGLPAAEGGGFLLTVAFLAGYVPVSWPELNGTLALTALPRSAVRTAPEGDGGGSPANQAR
jgi:hypothetical protein